MAPVTNHTIVVKINNVDRSSLLLADSLYIRSSIGNGNDVAEFSLRDVSQSFAPSDWDEVTIEVNGTRIFGGYIIQRDATTIGAGSHKRGVWQCQCKDWSILLDRVIVTRQFKTTDDDTIVASLFGEINTEGFDAVTNVTNVRQDIDISFEEITLREALNELAARAGANWHIAPDKKVYWYAPASPANAAFDIDTDSPNGSTTFNVLEGTLKKSIDSSQIVNRVRVIGAEAAVTVLQTDTFTGDGVTDKVGPLTKNPHSIFSVDYWLNGGRYIRHTSNIGYESNGDKLFADGGGHEIIANLDYRTVAIKHQNGDVPDNATDVVIKYYYTVPVDVTRNNSASQSAFGRVFEQSIYDGNLLSVAEAEAYADRLLDEYALGRESIRFDVAQHGLLPGRKINVKNTLLGLNADYLIQEVQFRAVAVSQDKFMIVVSVQCGKFVQSLIDTLKPGYSAGAGRIPAKSSPGKLSTIATDMGELTMGRATFTDGGTAKFEWGSPGGATGAVIGLEDINNNAYGAAYIYEGGTVRAKLGRLTDLPNLGTVTPTGWGLYTTNGYFSGRVVASTLIGGTIIGNTITGGSINGGQIVGGTVTGAQVAGGTVTGGLLTGGTINTNTGTIGGWRINGSHLWSIGGSISTSQVVNSSNPGIFMSTAGMFGYGTLGMTFGLWTDPARAPWFSSGTINNVVYEVYESAVIRTQSNVFANGGIQMDNSGLFGVSPIDGYGRLLLENGDRLLLEDGRGIELHGLKFALDTHTGRLFAEDAVIQGEIHAQNGRFSGEITASTITGGTITGAALIGASVIGQTISGSDVIGGTIVGVPIKDTGINNSQLDGNMMLGGTLSAAQIVGGTVTGGVFTGGNVSGGTLNAAIFNGGTINAARLNSGTINGAVVWGGTVLGGVFSGGTVSGGTLAAARFNGGTVSGALVTGNTVSGGTVSGALITGNTVSGGTVTGAQIIGGSIAGGTITGGYISGGTINAPGLLSISGGSITMGASSYGISFASAPGSSQSAMTWTVSGTAAAGAKIDMDAAGEPNLVIRRTTSGATNTSLILGKFNAYLLHSNNTGFNVHSSGIEVRGNLVPNGTTQTLGEDFYGWRYLYLRSPGGVVYRVGVDNSGNLVVT